MPYPPTGATPTAPYPQPGHPAQPPYLPPGAGAPPLPVPPPSNNTIYVSTSAVAKGYGTLGLWHGIIISMMGHEYGHHIQQISGISDSWWQQMMATRSQSARLALTRRHELQATFAGRGTRS